MARYDNRNVLILGAGRSGRAAARMVLEIGGRATVVDREWTAEKLAAFSTEGISCLTADDRLLPDGAYDLLVVSPSIPMNHDWLIAARDRGLSIISELELGAPYWKGDIIAVTGSKGKSSVVKCLTGALCKAGREAVTAGNYGTPLCERVLECPERGKEAIAVTEVSSFQLEHTYTFAPSLAAVLNLQADHLDRHGTLKEYTRLKLSLFQSQKPGTGHAFLPADIEPQSIPEGVTLERFGTDPQVDWRYTPGAVIHQGQAVPVSGYFDNAVRGQAAALIVAMLSNLDLSTEQIAEGFLDFEPLPHRMQRLGEVRGVTFIDDSKGTTLSATQAALQIVGHGVRLIAGGELKENDLRFLDKELASAARKAYLIGASQDELFDAWSTILPCQKCGDMTTAVCAALADAEPGDTVLLSPGAASFDQYSGMAARGEDFRLKFEAARARG